MCFSRGAIGCCIYNIRVVREDGYTLWRRRWKAYELSTPGPPYGGITIKPKAMCCAALSDGSTVIGGCPLEANRHIVGLYSAAGELLWSSGFSDLLPPPDDPPVDPYDHNEWWVPAITVTSDDHVVFAAHRHSSTPGVQTEFRLIEVDASGVVSASTSIISDGVMFLQSGPDGMIAASVQTSSGGGGVLLWPAERSAPYFCPFTTGGDSWIVAYGGHPLVRDALIRSTGENVVVARGHWLSLPSAIAEYDVAGGEPLWETDTELPGFSETGLALTIAELSDGKIIATGSVLYDGANRPLVLLSSAGVIEQSIEIAGAGGVGLFPSTHARITSSPMDGVLTWAQNSVSGFTLADGDFAKQWQHGGFRVWNATPHLDGRIALVGSDMRAADEDNYT